MNSGTAELLAQRFQFTGNLALNHDGYRYKRALEHGGIPRHEDGEWTRGVERESLERVRIVGRGFRWRWIDDLTHEAKAQRVMAAALPGVVQILHAGPGVVYAQPPEARSRPSLPAREAAGLTVTACEIVARLHTLGVSDLYYGPRNLRITPRIDGSWEMAWLIPGLASFDTIDQFEARQAEGQPWPRGGLAGLFASLLAEPVRTALTAGLSALSDPATVARHMLAHLDAEVWGPRVHALSALHPSRTPLLEDDDIIAEGERTIATASDDYFGFPVASMYHRRAAIAFDRRDLDAALQAIDRAVALDGHARYRITRAIILDAGTRTAEARREIDAAFAAEGLDGPPKYGPSRDKGVPDSERARAHATRGTIALRQDDLETAETDLRRAVELHATAAHAHALGAALFRRGDVAGAASAEAQSVALAPDDMRYRWALVVSLHRLGRVDEARSHMQQIIAAEPDDARHHARLARLVSEPGGSPVATSRWHKFWKSLRSRG